jgi:enoyl-[acyl-carrier protein] reductase I
MANPFDLTGKKALIMGLANERSLAWGIAKNLKEAGAELGFTYIEPLEKRMRPLAEQMDASLIAPCDVTSDSEIDALAKLVDDKWNGECDVLVHSLAFADREDLAREFVFTSREGFQKALEISAYSLVKVTAALLPALEKSKGSVMTMTYHGADKVIPHYNVMGVAKAALESSMRYLAYDCGKRGVRVNAISAGPVRTLAASGVKDFRSILTKIEEKSPLKRNIDIDDVGRTSLFLASQASSGVTGETIYVDSGFNIMGL